MIHNPPSGHTCCECCVLWEDDFSTNRLNGYKGAPGWALDTDEQHLSTSAPSTYLPFWFQRFKPVSPTLLRMVSTLLEVELTFETTGKFQVVHVIDEFTKRAITFTEDTAYTDVFNETTGTFEPSDKLTLDEPGHVRIMQTSSIPVYDGLPSVLTDWGETLQHYLGGNAIFVWCREQFLAGMAGGPFLTGSFGAVVFWTNDIRFLSVEGTTKITHVKVTRHCNAMYPTPNLQPRITSENCESTLERGCCFPELGHADQLMATVSLENEVSNPSGLTYTFGSYVMDRIDKEEYDELLLGAATLPFHRVKEDGCYYKGSASTVGLGIQNILVNIVTDDITGPSAALAFTGSPGLQVPGLVFPNIFGGGFNALGLKVSLGTTRESIVVASPGYFNLMYSCHRSMLPGTCSPATLLLNVKVVFTQV